MALFATEKIILQHNILGYRIDAYFPKYKLATDVDEQWHNSRDIDYEIERQKAIWNINVEIGKINSFIVKIHRSKRIIK